MRNAEGLGVERFVADGLALIGVKLGQQAVGISAGLSLGFAHDNMCAETIFQRATKFGGPGCHVVDQILGTLHRFGPHQIDVATFSSGVLGGW